VDVAGAAARRGAKSNAPSGQTWRANVAATFAQWGIPTRRRSATLAAFHPRVSSLPAAASETESTRPSDGPRREPRRRRRPFLRAAAQSTDDATATALQFAEELRIVMFLTGARTLDELRDTKDLRRVDET